MGILTYSVSYHNWHVDILQGKQTEDHKALCTIFWAEL